MARRPGLAAVDVTADDRKLLPDDTAPNPTIEVDGNLAGTRLVTRFQSTNHDAHRALLVVSVPGHIDSGETLPELT